MLTGQTETEEKLEAQVRDLIRQDNLDPLLEQERALGMIKQVLNSYDDQAARLGLASLQDREGVLARLFNRICGFGDLQKSGLTLPKKFLWPGLVNQN